MSESNVGREAELEQLVARGRATLVLMHQVLRFTYAGRSPAEVAELVGVTQTRVIELQAVLAGAQWSPRCHGEVHLVPPTRFVVSTVNARQ